jgi:hypothetical protein
MKKFGLLFLVVSNCCALEFKLLSDGEIRAASLNVARELEQLHYKRRIAKYVISVGLLGCAAGAVYKWSKDAPIGCQGLSPEVFAATQGVGIQNEPSYGFLAKCGGWVKSSCTGFFQQAPSGLGFAFFSSGATVYAYRMWQALDDFFKPLNLDWLLTDRLHFYKKIAQLKYTAAVLDPHSSDFSIFKDVTINWSDQLVSVFSYGERQHLSTFDELVKLKLVADRRLTLDKAGLSSYERLFVQQWNNLVDDITYFIGFIDLQLDAAGNKDQFERNQLLICREDMVRATRKTAQDLPLLIARDASHETSGMLTAIYEYANSVQHLCSILDNNEIVG